jgi:hypothetical protein
MGLESLKSGQRSSQDAELNTRIAQSFVEMPGLFAELAAHIRQCEVGAVFITEYFDLTRGSDLARRRLESGDGALTIFT